MSNDRNQVNSNSSRINKLEFQVKALTEFIIRNNGAWDEDFDWELWNGELTVPKMLEDDNLLDFIKTRVGEL